MHWLQRPAQAAPVPEEKDSDSMTQAEAFQGGFLRELDEDEKKRFAPLELIVVIGCGHTAVKIFIRLRLQKFVSPIYPQPLVRVLHMV